MKKRIKLGVVFVIALMIIVMFLKPGTVVVAMDKTIEMDINCGDSWKIPGQCLPVEREPNIVAPPGNYLNIDITSNPSKWIITVGVTIPRIPVLLEGNYNNFRIAGIKVFADERGLSAMGGYYSSLTVIVVLACDENGSTNPTSAFSVPVQYIDLPTGTEVKYPAATALGIKDQVRIMTTPCSY